MSEVGLLAFGLVVICAIQLFCNQPPFSDERDYLLNVPLLHQYGFGRAYLVRLVGSAGPLYSLVHFVFEPLTKLQAPAVRWVNIGFLLGMVATLKKILSLQALPAPRFAFYLLAIPMVYLIAGMALTEIPAMFFLCLAILLVVNLNLTVSHSRILYSCAAGLCMSLAIIGRQPFLLVLPAFPFLFKGPLTTAKNLLPVLLFFIFSLLLPVYVFWSWQGLVPTIEAQLYRDIAAAGIAYRPDYVLFCLLYFAVCLWLIAPPVFMIRPGRKAWLVGAIVGLSVLAGNAIFHWLNVGKQTFAKIFTGQTAQAAARNAGGSIVILICLLLLFSLWYQVHRKKYCPELLFPVLAMLAVAVACLKITWGFSPRYAGQAAPLLVLTGANFYRSSPLNLARIVMAIVLGAAYQLSYFMGQ